MKLLLLGGDGRARTALERLLVSTGHHLECRARLGPPRAALDSYDMILIMHCPDDPECPQRIIADIQHRARNATVLLVSPIDAHGAPSEEDSPGCGIIRSADGVLYLRCGLSRRAWREAGALLLRDCAGQSLSPVVFEYQK